MLAWSGDTAIGKLDRHTPSAGKVALPFVLANTVGWAYCLPLLFAVRREGPLGVVDAIPENERWARQRYGAAWDAYAARTPGFVPFFK